jgi:hypothetical protein
VPRVARRTTKRFTSPLLCVRMNLAALERWIGAFQIDMWMSFA